MSDGVSGGTRRDDTGEVLSSLLEDSGFEVVRREVVPDEVSRIAAAITELLSDARLVVTNGGTGLGPRDVTPEATAELLDRPIPGLAEAMRAAGRAKTPLADLSRGLVGAVGTGLVVNTPGSPKGARESLDAIVATLPHVLDLLAGHTRHEEGTTGVGHDHGHHRAQGHDHRDEQDHGHGAPGPSDEVVRALAARSASGEPSVLATVVDVEGEPPSALGRKALLGPAGPVAGTLGCSDFDAAASADVAEVIGEDAPRQRRYDSQHGAVTVQLEPFGAPDHLVIGGATPVARWLARWAADLGYRTTVVDRRPELLHGLEGIAGATAARIADVPLDARTDVVHTDHDAPGLVEDLAVALRSEVRSIGVMGSRRHAAPWRDALEHEGFAPERIERIASPVGLELGADARRIALGILADLARRPGG